LADNAVMRVEAKRRKPNGSKEKRMSQKENKPKRSGFGFHSHLYRAEIDGTADHSLAIKIMPNAPGHRSAGERQVAACIYELAAGLERGSEEIGGQWVISPQASDGRLDVELMQTDSPRRAKQLVEQVLVELSIHVTNPQ
jgi:hypothetical protein